MDLDLSWMAWTRPTAIFFLVIFGILTFFGILHAVKPSYPRVGVLGIPTQRGDRLFISLVAAAYINLAWLGLIGPNLWWAVGLSLVFAAAVFRWA